jgi:hypothetical protein
MKSHEQLNLFTVKINFAHLVAPSSPRCAFYRIWIEDTDGVIRVVKESGVKGRVLDRRIWPYADFEAAEKDYQRRIKSKTNPDRKSPRKYQLIRTS